MSDKPTLASAGGADAATEWKLRPSVRAHLLADDAPRVLAHEPQAGDARVAGLPVAARPAGHEAQDVRAYRAVVCLLTHGR